MFTQTEPSLSIRVCRGKVSGHKVKEKSGTDLGLSWTRPVDCICRVWALCGQVVLTGCEFFELLLERDGGVVRTEHLGC